MPGEEARPFHRIDINTTWRWQKPDRYLKDCAEYLPKGQKPKYHKNRDEVVIEYTF